MPSNSHFVSHAALALVKPSKPSVMLRRFLAVAFLALSCVFEQCLETGQGF